jgi:hypothetical protein
MDKLAKVGDDDGDLVPGEKPKTRHLLLDSRPAESKGVLPSL